MVDVTDKGETLREAVAEGRVVFSRGVLSSILEGKLPKGNVFAVAKLAGITGAKKTWELIPLCHQVPLTGVDLEFRVDEEVPGIVVRARARAMGKTGVEMEAMTAVAVSALSIYDMVKGVDRTAYIEGIRLLEKRGGRSGEFRREG